VYPSRAIFAFIIVVDFCCSALREVPSPERGHVDTNGSVACLQSATREYTIDANLIHLNINVQVTLCPRYQVQVHLQL